MRTKRPISINNSLVHGICNYSCRLCSINKTNYNGPKEFQPFEVTKTLIRRILESARSGVNIRYVTNSGDGEPTLHPEFTSRVEMFGTMLREWNIPNVTRPEVSVVTNGSRLHLPGITDSFGENSITMIISFPTVEPESYGRIMVGDAEKGSSLLSVVLPNIEKAIFLRAERYLSKLYFHISPPETEIIRNDFADTIDYLTNAACSNGLDRIELILFPASSNRSGLVHSSVKKIDMYRDLFKHYNGRVVNNVKISMKLVLKRFFHNSIEIADLIRSFRFPCLWNANFFITSDGSSICCNDQTVKYPQGNIMFDSLETLMEMKEQFSAGPLCSVCNQSPHRLKGSPEANLFSFITRMRTFSAVLHDKVLPGKKKVNSQSGSYRKENSPEPMREITDIAGTDDEPFFNSMLSGSISDSKGAFRLIYDSYLSYGFQENDPSRMRIKFHNLLPVSYLLVVKRAGKIAGTITLIRDNSFGLPVEKLFKEEVSKIRTANSLVCELSGLAVGASIPHTESRQILMSLFRYAFILGRDILGCTDFCMMTNPRHSMYYRKEFNYEQIGEVKYYDQVNGAPAVPLHLSLGTAEKEFQKTNPVLFKYFSVNGRNNSRKKILTELHTHEKLYCTDYIENLKKSGNRLFENLTAEMREILRSYYPETERMNR